MRLNFRQKLFTAFFTLSVLVAGGVTAYTYVQVSVIPEELTRKLLMAAVANAAQRFDADQIRSLASSGAPESSEEYRRLHAELVRINEAPPHFSAAGGARVPKDIYILVRPNPAAPGAGRLLVTIKPGEAGRDYDMSRFKAMMDAWTDVAADTTVASDEFASSLSAYAPIRDRAGNAVAILGMDAPAVYVDAFHRTIRHSIILVFAIPLVAAVPLAMMIARKLNRPIELLHGGMQDVALGRLDTQLPRLLTGDEFEPLLQHFNDMVRDLKSNRDLERAMDVAREIQQQLLPQHPPTIAGFEIADCAQYCDKTGGDYFDYIPLGPPGRFGIAVGDVTGHGIGAALLMTAARAVLRSHAPRFAGRLAPLLTEVNNHLVHDTDDRLFVTLFYGELDGQARTLTFASAGHEPVLWYRAADRSIHHLESTGIPLGILQDATYEQSAAITLATGDVVVIPTDGIREARDESGELFGLVRLGDALRASAAGSAGDVHAAILKAVREFRRSAPQRDDVTLVVIKATA